MAIHPAHGLTVYPARGLTGYPAHGLTDWWTLWLTNWRCLLADLLADLLLLIQPFFSSFQEDYRFLYNSLLQLCDPQLEEDQLSTSCPDQLEQYANTFANVRRINTLPRSPDHQPRVDTLWRD